MSKRHQIGHATLGLLAEDWSVPVIGELAQRGPLRPSELEECLPHVPHSALMRRLSQMHGKGIVSRERRQGLPPHARYSLTRQGRLILEILAAAERWERRWLRSANHGSSALALLADERNREIVLAVARGGASAKTLKALLPGSSRTLQRRLVGLVSAGILVRVAHSGAVSYRLSERARQLARVGVAAVRWEWRWAKPEEPAPADNIAAIVHLFAPTARISGELTGICALHVEDEPAASKVHLTASAGRLAALASAPDEGPVAVCHGTPRGWMDALLLARPCGITATTGHAAFVAAVLASLSAALVA